jgi:hypothetical protein
MSRYTLDLMRDMTLAGPLRLDLWRAKRVDQIHDCLRRSHLRPGPSMAFWHAFAVNYFRRGGSVFHVQKLLDTRRLK